MNITIYANHIKQNANLVKRIQKVCPQFVKSLEIIEAGMERAGGTGSYYCFIEGACNGEIFRFKRHTNHAPLWDWYNDIEGYKKPFQDWKKSLIISLLEDYFASL